MKKIVGYENYFITTCGKVLKTKNNDFKILKTRSKGYSRVTLKKCNESKTFHVHRLVALSFLKNIRNKKEVNHINEIKSDNYIGNLEWSTRCENMNHGTWMSRRLETLKK